jgi:NADH:ubiquinone oxidoreductase subunit 3 (subunit A)
MRNWSVAVVVVVAAAAVVVVVVVVAVVVEKKGGGRWRRGAPFEDGVASVTDAGAWSGPGERVFRPAHY